MKPPFFSIICPCHNNGEFLPKLVESLEAQTFKDFDVVFIDDCSTQMLGLIGICGGKPSWREERVNGINDYIKGTYGFCRSCNDGARLSRGRYLWFINPDVWFEPDCLEELHWYIGRTGARYLNARELKYDNDLDIHHPLFPHGAKGFDVFANYLAPEQHGYFLAQPSRLLYSGNHQIFERTLFETVGGYDGWRWIGRDEEDNGWRVAIAGESNHFCAKARLHHFIKEQKSLVAFESKRMYRITTNQFYIILKNAQHVLLLMFPLCVGLALVEALVLSVLCRKPSILYWTWIRPLAVVAGQWKRILRERKFVRDFRKRSDWWFIRNHIYFTEFGHSSLVKGLWRKLVPGHPTGFRMAACWFASLLGGVLAFLFLCLLLQWSYGWAALGVALGVLGLCACLLGWGFYCLLHND